MLIQNKLIESVNYDDNLLFEIKIKSYLDKIEFNIDNFYITFDHDFNQLEANVNVTFKLNEFCYSCMCYSIVLEEDKIDGNYYSSAITESFSVLIMLNLGFEMSDINNSLYSHDQIFLNKMTSVINIINNSVGEIKIGERILKNLLHRGDLKEKKDEFIKNELKKVYERFGVSKELADESINEYLVLKIMES